jgi:hypothetical protein
VTTTTLGVTFVQAAELVAAHLARHELPEPVSLTVMTLAGHSQVTTQVHSGTVARVAGDLLAWADTVTTVVVQAWRPPYGGSSVHLAIASTLTGPANAVKLDVYGGADDDLALFADLAPGDRWTVSLEHLRTWAAPATGTPDGGAEA